MRIGIYTSPVSLAEFIDVRKKYKNNIKIIKDSIEEVLNNNCTFIRFDNDIFEESVFYKKDSIYKIKIFFENDDEEEIKESE